MRQNIFINTGSFVEYDNLVTYIDWMVSQVSPLDDDNFGVLKAETIAGWDVLNGNYATGEISTGVSASYGIGASLVSTITLITASVSHSVESLNGTLFQAFLI